MHFVLNARLLNFCYLEQVNKISEIDLILVGI